MLFNLPDFIVISTYTLLMNVWLECYQQSRKTWFPARRFRKRWMTWYLIFNTVLYSSQLVMYIILMIATNSAMISVIINAIYYSLTAFNFALPAGFLFTWIGFTIQYAGFPYKSKADAQRMSKVGRLALVWSIARLLYASVITLAFLKNWLSSSFTTSSKTAEMWFVALYMAAELAPFYIALSDYDLFAVQPEDSNKNDGMGEKLGSEIRTPFLSNDKIRSSSGMESPISDEEFFSDSDSGETEVTESDEEGGNDGKAGQIAVEDSENNSAEVRSSSFSWW